MLGMNARHGMMRGAGQGGGGHLTPIRKQFLPRLLRIMCASHMREVCINHLLGGKYWRGRKSRRHQKDNRHLSHPWQPHTFSLREVERLALHHAAVKRQPESKPRSAIKTYNGDHKHKNKDNRVSKSLGASTQIGQGTLFFCSKVF